MEATQTRLSGEQRPVENRPGRRPVGSGPVIDQAVRPLWQAFRDAFGEFQRQARRLAEIKARPTHDPAEAEKALMCVEHARLAYNEMRDLVAASLMSPECSEFFWEIPASAQRDETRVKSLAELLWELAGKPQGSAEDDWYRAERVVRHAATESACAH